MLHFFANLGYAVLQVNYRGSTGYGRKFEEAAIGEFAGKMHTDLIDAVNWAIQQGIADPARIGIFGRSYGGYATLVGMTFTPELFACGVDICGMSNLMSLLESVPEYWKPWMAHFHRYVGNPENPEDIARMKQKSPLFKTSQIQRPLLIVQSGNDVRVRQQESDQIVKAAKANGKDVEYLVLPDEGHFIQHWQNQLIYLRRVEDFFAEHLGGRSAGFDYYELFVNVFK